MFIKSLMKLIFIHFNVEEIIFSNRKAPLAWSPDPLWKVLNARCVSLLCLVDIIDMIIRQRSDPRLIILCCIHDGSIPVELVLTDAVVRVCVWEGMCVCVIFHHPCLDFVLIFVSRWPHTCFPCEGLWGNDVNETERDKEAERRRDGGSGLFGPSFSQSGLIKKFSLGGCVTRRGMCADGCISVDLRLGPMCLFLCVLQGFLWLFSCVTVWQWGNLLMNMEEGLRSVRGPLAWSCSGIEDFFVGWKHGAITNSVCSVGGKIPLNFLPRISRRCS